MSLWEKAFDAFTWKNKSESTETPLDASHLNRINTALDTIDDRVITLQDDLDDKVDKNGTDRLMTDEEGTKLSEIETGAEVNVLEGVQIDGDDLPISDKKVNIDLGSYIYKSIQLPYQDTIKVNDAVATNAEDVKVKFEPVQDLHGYGRPWVGGAGKNKIILTTAAIKSDNGGASSWTNNSKVINGITWTILEDNNGNVTGIKANGTCSGGTSGIRLFVRDIETSTYTFGGVPTGGGSSTYRLWYGKRNLSDTGWVKGGNTDSKCTVSIDTTTTSYVRIEPEVYVGANVSNIIFTPYWNNMATNPNDYTFESYSNICYISGKSSLDVQWQGDSQGSLLPIQLGGTWYGGNLDVTTGVLTVDRAIVDLGTLNWEKLSNSRFEAKLNGFKYETNAYAIPNMKCSAYKTLSYAAAATAEHAINSYTADSYVQIRDISHTNTSASDFKTAMSGVQLVYELATPVTYDLTPHDIALYLNNNTLWSPTSGCQVSLKYKASELSGKADMVVNATPDDLVALDEDGNIIDTGVSYVKNKVVDYASSISVSDALAEEATVKIKVEPYQDLHGYSKPWAGGCGKNLLPNEITTATEKGLDFTTLDNGKIEISGTSTADIYRTNICTDFSLPEGEYILSYDAIPYVSVQVCNRAENVQYANVTQSNTSRAFAVTSSMVNDIRVRFITANGVTVDATTGVMIRRSSITDATFEPYSNICPISGRNESVLTLNGSNIFFDLGGVQYGGVINNDGTMTVDRGFVILDGSSDEVWHATVGTNVYTDSYTSVIKKVADTEIANIMCNRFKATTAANTYNGTVGIAVYQYGYIAFSYDGINHTLAEFKTWLSNNPLQVVYELATPITIQLSPQQITLLKGSNTLSASSGDVRLEYRASVIDELESQIADILARLNALEEV